MRVRNNVFIALLVLLSVAGVSGADNGILTYLERGSLGGAAVTAASFSQVKKLGKGVMDKWAGKKAIFAARMSHPKISALLKKFSIKPNTDWLGEQGFRIVTSKVAGRDVIIVTANTHVGVLYGLIRIREELKKTGGKNPFALKLNLRDRPAFRFRAVGPYANYRQYWGNFNCEDFTMEDFPELFASKEEYERWVKRSYKRLEKLKKMVSEADKWGIRIYMHVRAPIIPYQLRSRKAENPHFNTQLKKVYPEAFATPRRSAKKRGITHYYCYSSKIMKRIVRLNYERIFRKVPGLDGLIVVVRNGGGGYLVCNCPKCRKLSGLKRMRCLLDDLKTTMRKHNPKAEVILRDWGLYVLGLSVDKLAASLPEDVLFLTKLTVPPGSDYLWYDHFTPKIHAPRLLVFGCNLFHANDSIPAHMFYLGGKMKQRAIKMLDAGVLGVWDGDENSLSYGCANLNDKAIAEVAWNPRQFDPLDYLKRWARKNFGKAAAKHVVKALYESWKITDYLVVDEYRTSTTQIFHWDPNRPSRYALSVGQNEAIKKITETTFSKLRQRYEGLDALKRSSRMADEIARACAALPNNAKLIMMLKWANATKLLVKTVNNYNMALLYYNLYGNTQSVSAEKAGGYLKQAASHIKSARKAKNDYLAVYTTIPETKSMQGLRYKSSISDEVEHGYDCILTTGTILSHRAKADKSEKSKLWKKKKTSERTWRTNKTLIIPAVLKTNDPEFAREIQIVLEADLSKGAILRIQVNTFGKRNFFGYNRSDAEILIDGKKTGRLARSVQGSMYPDRDRCIDRSHPPHKCWRSFFIPPQSGKIHTIIIKALPVLKRKQCLGLVGLELRYFQVD